MKLTKPMIKAFAHIVRGENTLHKLAEALHKSVYWADIVLNSLEQEGFVVKKRNYSLRGSRLLIEIANTRHAAKLRELLFQYPGISFEEILSESRLLFLAALSEDWMSEEIAIQLSKISKYSIDRYRPQLKNRGVIVKKKGLYKVNDKAWPLLKEFLIAYKDYSKIQGLVRWKYNEEVLFQLNNESLIEDNATGFYEYKNHGVNAGVISVLCILPKRRLSKEEIFVHSLFEVNDPRTLHLALTFYLKNKLSYRKVLPVAMKYGKYTMFENMVSLLKSREDKIKLEELPAFERADFKRIAGMYGVKNV